MARFTLAAACAFCLLASARTLPAQTKIIPPEWLPALAPAVDSMLAALKEVNTQAEMNSLSRQITDMRDAQLFVAYVRLYERLDPKARAKLLQEQTTWLEARTKAARIAVESKGGSLAALEANDAEATLTEKRLSELRARLKTAPKKKQTADE